MKLTKSHMITVDYFGVTLTVPNCGCLATDSDGKCYWYMIEPYPSTRALWFDNNPNNSVFHVCDLDLNGMDWRETLRKVSDLPQPHRYHLNDPKRLAPIDCHIVINVSGKLLPAKRTRPIDNNGVMEYKLDSGEIITGAYFWSYP